MNSRASHIDNGNVKAAMSKLAREGDSRMYSVLFTHLHTFVRRSRICVKVNLAYFRLPGFLFLRDKETF